MPDTPNAASPLALEVVPVRRVGRVVECLLRRGGGSLRVRWPVAASAHEAVLRYTTDIGLAPVVCHSTSWRQDVASVLVTFVVVVEGDAPVGCTFRPVGPAELRRGDALAAPRDVSALDAVRHGLAHLAWLFRTDAAVGDALRDWGDALAPFDPEPFRALSSGTPRGAEPLEPRTTQPAPLLLRPQDAAEALAVSRTKLFELLASGELESVRIGSCRRIPLSAVERFVLTLRDD